MQDVSPTEDALLAIEHVEIDTLEPAPYNPRTISGRDRQALERSLTGFGFVDPIVVRRADNTVIGGNQRLLVARELGFRTVPVVFIDLSEEKAKLLNLALNNIAGDWNPRLLAELLRELDELPELDLEIAGFYQDDVKRLFAAADWVRDQDEDIDIEAAMERARAASRVRPGETWRLGRHLPRSWRRCARLTATTTTPRPARPPVWGRCGWSSICSCGSPGCGASTWIGRSWRSSAARTIPRRTARSTTTGRSCARRRSGSAKGPGR